MRGGGVRARLLKLGRIKSLQNFYDREIGVEVTAFHPEVLSFALVALYESCLLSFLQNKTEQARCRLAAAHQFG